MRRYAVPKETNSRANRRAGKLSVHLTSPFHEVFPSRSRYGMLRVDESTRFKMVRFTECRRDAVAALIDIIDMHIATVNFTIGIIRTDVGVEFAEPFETLGDKLRNGHGCTAPYTSQYNGIIERASRLLPDKTVVLPRGVTEGKEGRPITGRGYELRLPHVKSMRHHLHRRG